MSDICRGDEMRETRDRDQVFRRARSVVAVMTAQTNAKKLREVAEYYDQLAEESAAHGFVAAPLHHKEVGDLLRTLANHIDA